MFYLEMRHECYISFLSIMRSHMTNYNLISCRKYCKIFNDISFTITYIVIITVL